MSSFSVRVGARVKDVKPLAQTPVWENFGFNVNTAASERDVGPDRFDPGEGDEKEMRFTDEKLRQIEEKAYSSGYAEGERVGRAEATAEAKVEIQPQIQFLDNAIKAIQEEREAFFQENELHIVKLAMEIAKKIIQRELQQNPEILLYVVREAMRRVGHGGRIVVRVNPEDIKILEDTGNILGNQKSAFSAVDFVASDEVLRGGCIIDSESGIIDAQLDVQLERIENRLLEGVDG